MQSVSHSSLHSSSRPGFTLVLTLIVLSAITLLVLGLFANVTSESSTATNYDNAFRAQTAVRSGLSRVEALLKQGTWSDDYLVLEHMQNPPPVGSTPTNEQWRNRRPVLTLARAKVTGDTTGTAYATEWEYTPLTSGVNPPANTTGTPSLPTTALAAKEDANTKAANITAEGLPKRLPWQPTQDSYWEVIYEDQDADGDPKTPAVKVPVARYCFQVEDLQGLLSLDHAGNPGDAIEEATGMLSRPHEREKIEVFEKVDDASDTPRRWYAGLAPGLRTPDDDPLTDDRKWGMSQAALYSLIDPTSAADTSVIDNQIMVARHTQRSGSPTQVASLLLSPDSWKPILMKEDIANPWPTWLERTPIETNPDGTQITDVDTGRLQDSPARRLEENTITGLKSYYECPMVPVEPGVFAHPREHRMNLNRIITQVENGSLEKNDAVDILRTHIEKYLPQFKELRVGSNGSTNKGFPFGSGNYLNSLCASIVDYADSDCVPTLVEGAYRGSESSPLVSEQFLQYRWDPPKNGETDVKDGQRILRLTVLQSYELWNMSNRPIRTKLQSEWSVTATVSVGSAAFKLDNEAFEYLEEGSSGPIKDNGYWLPLYSGDSSEKYITIRPNEYKVVSAQEVTFAIPLGPATIVKSVPSVGLKSDSSSIYRLRMSPEYLVQNPELFGKRDEEDQKNENWFVFDTIKSPLHRLDRTISSKSTFISSMTIAGSSYHPKSDSNAYFNNIGDPRAAFYFDSDMTQAAVAYDSGGSPGGRNYRKNINDDLFYKEIFPSKWPDRGYDSYSHGNTPSNASTKPLDVPLPPRGYEPQKAIMIISNSGRYLSATELGNIYDPLFWDPDGFAQNEPRSINDAAWRPFWDISLPATPTRNYCGGNTLRVGRLEHRRFRSSYTGGILDTRRAAASTLLDLFHCGISTVGDKELPENLRDLTGPLIEVQGQSNINTATPDVLRSILSGGLKNDPTKPAIVASGKAIDSLINSIIKNRPYSTKSQLADRISEFGSESQISNFGGGTTWTDASAEEVFARTYNGTTVRSRNFRVFVSGQSVRPLRSDPSKLEVLSTRTRMFHVFVHPIRDASTGLIQDQRIEITYEQDL